MIKKIIILFLIGFLIALSSFASEINIEPLDNVPLSTTNKTYAIPEILSKYSIVLERSTNTILFEKNGFEKTPMASTTKIMTAIIVIENTNLSDIVTISKNATLTSGSKLGIRENSKISINTLLYGLLLRSGNDCAVALAEYISHSVDAFSILMNNKAKELGLKNTNFVTPHGLDSENHYTTAYDLAILTNYALNNQTFKNIVQTKATTIDINNSSKKITNTNELLGHLDGVYGVKTGFTGLAGRCLVTACKRKNLDIIIVILGADTKRIRTEDSIKVINYIYNNFEMINTKDFLESKFEQNKIKICNYYKNTDIYLENKNNYNYPVLKKTNTFDFKIYLFSNIPNDLKKDKKIGIVKIVNNNQSLYEVNILLAEDIEISQYDYFIYLIKYIKNMYT